MATPASAIESTGDAAADDPDEAAMLPGYKDQVGPHIAQRKDEAAGGRRGGGEAATTGPTGATTSSSADIPFAVAQTVVDESKVQPEASGSSSNNCNALMGCFALVALPFLYGIGVAVGMALLLASFLVNLGKIFTLKPAVEFRPLTSWMEHVDGARKDLLQHHLGC